MMHGSKQCLIRFEKRTKARHPVSNERLDVWNEHTEIWCRLEGKRITETVKLGSEEVMITHLLFGDHDDLETVTDDMRALYEPTGEFKSGDEYLPGTAFFRINGIKRDFNERRRTEMMLTQGDKHTAK